MKPIKIPVGAARGKLITACSVAELEDACSVVEARLCAVPEGSSANSVAKLKRFVGAARPLLSRRKFPTGSFATADHANRALCDAAEVGFLISPSGEVAQVLDGTAIVISAFRVDVQHDTFADDENPKLRVPAKPMLDRVANLLNVSWVAEHCKRLDIGSSPYVRAAQAAATVKNFDGSDREMQARGEIDLTNGSALATAILRRFPGNKGQIELARRRQFILAHVDTTARMRVIRQLGLRDGYLPSELEQKAFFVARVVFTGASADPATKAAFAGHIAEAFLPASSALFRKPKRASGER